MTEGRRDRSTGVTVSFWPDAYVQHAPALRNYLRRRLRSTELAEDLTHDAFVRAFDARDRLRDPGRIRAYLYRTAHRLLLNHRRRPALLQSENELDHGVDLAELGADDGTGGEAAVQERELQEALLAILGDLPDDQARAFTWAVLEQRSYDEIADHTGWSRSKVKISVFRARQKVMQGLLARGMGLPERRGTG